MHAKQTRFQLNGKIHVTKVKFRSEKSSMFTKWMNKNQQKYLKNAECAQRKSTKIENATEKKRAVQTETKKGNFSKVESTQRSMLTIQFSLL